MKKVFINMKWLIWVTVALVMMSGNAFAADCPKDIKAVTAKDADVSVEVLEFLVKPLTKCELEAEAKAWLVLLQAKVTEISEAEIAALYKKEEIKKAEEVESTQQDIKEAKEEHDREAEKESAEQAKAVLKEKKEAEKKSAQDVLVQKAIKDATKKASEEDHPVTADAADKEAKEELKSALVRHATNLMAERTTVIDLFEVVLAELELKGGEIKEYNSYIKAVSGIKVDVTDASATWTTITGWLLSPEGGIRWAINLGKFIVILVVSYFLSIVAGKAAKRIASKSPNLIVLAPRVPGVVRSSTCPVHRFFCRSVCAGDKRRAGAGHYRCRRLCHRICPAEFTEQFCQWHTYACLSAIRYRRDGQCGGCAG